MSKKLSEIENDARNLSTRERARLVRRLLVSLEADTDGDVEQQWLDEAAQRLEAYRRGESDTRPGEEVFEIVLNRA